MKGAIIKMKKGRKTKIYRTFRLPSFAGGLPALAITVILTASLLLFGVGGTKLALISAGLAMPEGGIEYIKENSPSVKDKTETTGSEAQASATVQSRNAPESEEKASETEKSFDIAATPSDILAAMAEFESKHSSEKGDGKIVETKYGKANATNTYKNICIKNTTQTKSINIEKVLNEPIDLKAVDKSQPAVLIFHTHTTEGYEMLDTLAKRSDNVFELKVGTLYPLLHGMVQSGYLKCYSQEANGKLRKYYQITPSGKKYLAKMTEEWNRYASAVQNLLQAEV